MDKTFLIVIAIVIFILPSLSSAGWLSNDGSRERLSISYERGFIGVLKHNIQLGERGTRFDYVAKGGQNILFPFSRLSAEIDLGDKHILIFLAQPIDIRTESVLRENLTVEDQLFPAGTPMRFRYGFDFYRLSYLYRLIDGRTVLDLGLSLQIRNATISFASQDGSLLKVNQNIGPVPIFKSRLKKMLGNRLWIEIEADGFYASGRYITGSGNDFAGAILDASSRLGFTFTKSIEAFINVRYLGGGARGTEEDKDKYTDNWLHTTTISLGCRVE